jgi:hypothetical protein
VARPSADGSTVRITEGSTKIPNNTGAGREKEWAMLKCKEWAMVKFDEGFRAPVVTKRQRQDELRHNKDGC